MEILAKEISCYILLAFICIKMEVNWHTKAVGKVGKNLPSLKKLTEGKFTQNFDSTNPKKPTNSLSHVSPVSPV